MQALRPFADTGGLHIDRRIGPRQRMHHQLGPAAQPLRHQLLVADALLIDVALEDPSRREGEQQQHDHDRGVDAQVEALHAAIMPAPEPATPSMRLRVRPKSNEP